MLSAALFSLALAGAFLSTPASAQCQASGTRGSGVQPDTGLCVPQGVGQWTFSMAVSGSCVPSPDGPPTAGCVEAGQFIIQDESCNIMSTYTLPSCGTPFIIEENFLTQVMTLTAVSEDVGDPYFSFTYGNGQYSINNNQCGCVNDNSGLTGGAACKCAFPIDGVFNGKRDVAVPFQA